MYKLLFAAVFRRMPTEAAHRAGFGLIRIAAACREFHGCCGAGLALMIRYCG